MDDKWLIALGALVVLLAVFALKVWHASGVCADLNGRWTDGDCVFEERLVR